jgi:hypothetical protein
MEHNKGMRTSINLDEDVYQLASLYAAGRGITLSAAINEVFLRMAAPAAPPVLIETAPNGMPLFPSRGRIITPEMVKAAQEDENELG